MGKKGRGIRNPTSPFPCLHPSPTASFLRWPPDLLLHSPPAATWPPLTLRLKPDLLFCSTQQSLWLPWRVFSDKTMEREREKKKKIFLPLLSTVQGSLSSQTGLFLNIFYSQDTCSPWSEACLSSASPVRRVSATYRQRVMFLTLSKLARLLAPIPFPRCSPFRACPRPGSSHTVRLRANMKTSMKGSAWTSVAIQGKRGSHLPHDTVKVNHGSTSQRPAQTPAPSPRGFLSYALEHRPEPTVCCCFPQLSTV